MEVRMSRNYLLKLAKISTTIFLVTLFMSCSAASHVGQTFVNEPSINESNEQTWFTYYQDQFDAFEGNVLSPQDNYPKVARQAYQRASLDWNNKVSSAKSSSQLLLIGGLILIPIIIGTVTLLAL